MLVQKMSIPDHGDSDSSGISTSTRLPDAALQDPAMDLTSIIKYNGFRKPLQLHETCIPMSIYDYILLPCSRPDPTDWLLQFLMLVSVLVSALLSA